MCVIIAKNKNNRLPTENELKNCFEYNSDGAGFMFTNNKKVIITKGYMDYNSFIKEYNKLCKKYNNFKNKCLVIHCRIGTSSTNSKGNTHPYIITDKENDLHNTNISGSLGIAHNGIIHDYTPLDKNTTINDTQNFIINYLYPLYKNYNDFYKNSCIMDGIQKITNSKFAFLDNNDDLYIVGDFIDNNNLLFSNTSYIDYTTRYKNYNYNYNYFKDYYNKDNDDDYYIDDDDDIIDLTADDSDLIKVKDDYYITTELTADGGDIYYRACDYAMDLYYDPLTYELYERYNNEYLKIADDIIIYDKDYKQIV